MKQVLEFAAAVVATLWLGGGGALADGGERSELLEILRANGTITDEQYRQLEAAAGPELRTKGGIKLHAADGRFQFELGGRVMVDAAFYDQDATSLGDGTKLRRARVTLSGRVYDHWKFKGAYDFGDEEVEVKDAYLGYLGFAPLALTIGHFKGPFGLEELTSSNHITFMERALPAVFAPGRNLGIGIHAHGEQGTLAAGVFGEGGGDEHISGVDEGWGGAGRATYVPLHGERQTVHLGVAAAYRHLSDGAELELDPQPESDIADVALVETGVMANAEEFTIVGVEAALVRGPLSLQGEYVQMAIGRAGGETDLRFDGWYAYLSWFLTGETRVYELESGEFGRVDPRRPVGGGGRGAWEVGVRYSTIDLDDGPVAGGKEDNLTFGLNWYVNPQVRFMANYIRVAADTVVGDDDPSIFQLRAQVFF